jgi:hypothetical protein
MNTPKCSTCRDTGHRDPSSFDLDCTDCDVAEQRAALEKWCNETQQRGPSMDDCWAIHQRALAMAPKQEAPTDECDTWRAAGRAEALSILMGLCPETGIDEYTGWSSSGSPEDEGCAHWNEEKLRELLHVDSALADMMSKAEAAYYDYRSQKDEAEHAKAFAANMHSSGRVREVLAKAGEYDLIGDLCRAAPAAANGVMTDEQIKEVAIDYAQHVAGDVYDVTKYNFPEDFFNCVRAILAAAGPDAALMKAAQAMKDEQDAACVTDSIKAITEMADDDEEVLVTAKLLLQLFAALSQAGARGAA